MAVAVIQDVEFMACGLYLGAMIDNSDTNKIMSEEPAASFLFKEAGENPG